MTTPIPTDIAAILDSVDGALAQVEIAIKELNYSESEPSKDEGVLTALSRKLTEPANPDKALSVTLNEAKYYLAASKRNLMQRAAPKPG